MIISAFEGAAGCGKTHKLMDTLHTLLEQSPMQERQRVLAITFMHGSKKRLSERLGKLETIRRKYACMTVDAFALHICNRWKTLSGYMRLPRFEVSEYDKCCTNAAKLLSDPFVIQWVGVSFPIIIIDEAQDLSQVRLSIVQAFVGNVNLLIAADEYQCLVQGMKPNPLTNWLPSVCKPEILTIPRRTSSQGLLNASGAIRGGEKLVADKDFKIFVGATTHFSGNLVANGVAWGKVREIAIITPTIKGKYATDIVDWVGANRSTKGNGPYTFRWESSDQEYVADLIGDSLSETEYYLDDVIRILRRLPSNSLLQTLIAWLQKQNQVLGRTRFASTEIRERLVRYVEVRRQSMDVSGHHLRAMTIHQAKNREFDGVIVLWPIRGNVGQDDHKRRLLYNAVTRAKKWCTVIVQRKDMLDKAPFV